MMNKYTVFCRGSDGIGTTWISTVEAQNVANAMLQGRAECSVDWDTDEDNVTVIGVAEGDVRILHWEDL